MKKTFLFTALAAALSLGISAAQAAEKLVVGATAVPHAEILELIKPELAKEGVDLQIKVFTDYVQPNVQLNEKRLDANYFQTKPYLDGFNKGKGATLVTGVGVHVEPFGGYSKKWKSIDQLPEGATVAIPNEGSNAGRALLLLQKNGLITLKDPTNALSTPKDIATNPKKLKMYFQGCFTQIIRNTYSTQNTPVTIHSNVRKSSPYLALMDGILSAITKTRLRKININKVMSNNLPAGVSASNIT